LKGEPFGLVVYGKSKYAAGGAGLLTLIQGRSWVQPVHRCKRKRTNQRKGPKVKEAQTRLRTKTVHNASHESKQDTTNVWHAATRCPVPALGARIVSSTTFARCAIVTNDGRRVRSLWRSFRERQKPGHGPPCVRPREATGRNTKTLQHGTIVCNVQRLPLGDVGGGNVGHPSRSIRAPRLVRNSRPTLKIGLTLCQI